MAVNSHSHFPIGSHEVDAIFTILLSTDIFVGLVVGFILDNTIPGMCNQYNVFLFYYIYYTEDLQYNRVIS